MFVLIPDQCTFVFRPFIMGNLRDLAIVLLLGVCVQGAAVPETFGFPQTLEKEFEYDNIQVATSQEGNTIVVAPPKPTMEPQQQEESVQIDLMKDTIPNPQLPLDPPITVQEQLLCLLGQTEKCQGATDIQKKLQELILKLQLTQKPIGQVQNLEGILKKTAILTALGVSTGAVAGESGSNLYGGINSLLTSTGGTVIDPATGLPIVGSTTLGVVPTAFGNLLTLLSTIAGNLHTPLNNLTAIVGPTGIPINLGTISGIPSNVLGNIPTTGIIAPGSLLTLLSQLGSGGNLAVGGTPIISGQLPTITGLLPTITGLPSTITGLLPTLGGLPSTITGLLPTITVKPTLATLIHTILTGGLSGLRSFRESSNEENNEKGTPWIVFIKVNGKLLTQGVLISDQHVLTAASPLINIHSKEIEVYPGQSYLCNPEESAQMVTVSSVLANPYFNPQTKSHDLALLKLSMKMEWISQENKVLPLCLPSLSSQHILKEVTVPSWKSSSDDQLCSMQKLQLPLMALETCSKYIDPQDLLTIDKSCMGTKIGDQNVCEEIIVGTPVLHMASDGIVELLGINNNPAHCEKSDTIHFVRIQDHLPWLLENMKDDILCMRI